MHYFIVFEKHSCYVMKWWKVSDYSRHNSLHPLALPVCVCGKQALSSVAEAGYGNSRVQENKEKGGVREVGFGFCGERVSCTVLLWDSLVIRVWSCCFAFICLGFLGGVFENGLLRKWI